MSEQAWLVIGSNVLAVVVATAINKTDISWLKQNIVDLREDIKELRGQV